MPFLRPFSIFRGGGIFLPSSFYDTADRLGVLIFHDQMFTTTTTTHEPHGTADEALEIRQNVRQLAHHPSIAVWNACNECSGRGLYVTLVMTTVAEEDDSRPIWPSVNHTADSDPHPSTPQHSATHVRALWLTTTATSAPIRSATIPPWKSQC